jgi:hypothetical protein
MTKKDLRTGHIVTLRNGNKYKVFLNASIVFGTGDAIVRDIGFMPLNNFDINLEHKADMNMDIVKVECVDAYHLLDKPIGSVEYETVWERTKKMTVAEIEAILGYKVEIISDQ